MQIKPEVYKPWLSSEYDIRGLTKVRGQASRVNSLILV